jgi:hypothetical protein
LGLGLGCAWALALGQTGHWARPALAAPRARTGTALALGHRARPPAWSAKTYDYGYYDYDYYDCCCYYDGGCYYYYYYHHHHHYCHYDDDDDDDDDDYYCCWRRPWIYCGSIYCD